jgi:hypothetical protein
MGPQGTSVGSSTRLTGPGDRGSLASWSDPGGCAREITLAVACDPIERAQAGALVGGVCRVIVNVRWRAGGTQHQAQLDASRGGRLVVAASQLDAEAIWAPLGTAQIPLVPAVTVHGIVGVAGASRGVAVLCEPSIGITGGGTFLGDIPTWARGVNVWPTDGVWSAGAWTLAASTSPDFGIASLMALWDAPDLQAAMRAGQPVRVPGSCRYWRLTTPMERLFQVEWTLST